MEVYPIYLFTFIALYVQVYLLIVLFEEWDTIFASTKEKNLTYYPEVVIAVPCWNESKTVEKTILSLLAINYPKYKFKIWAVDDGSKDNTFEILKNCKEKYDKFDQLIVLQKENGGKHTVLNFVLEKNPDCEIFGCLDADSFVFPDALKNMLIPFEENKEVMAVTPMMVVRKPENILQAIQSVEYNFGLLLKRIFSAINGIHVTPGPFSLFRRVVFEKIGGYKPAHNTEDMEITFRMQKNFMKIVSATDAYVETSTPDTFYKLYKQRLRWTQGFMQNSLDYKDMILRPKYGNVAMLTIPLGWVGVVMVLYIALFTIYTFVKKIIHLYQTWQVLKLDMIFHHYDLIDMFMKIYFRTDFLYFLVVPVLVSGIIFMLMGHHLSLKENRKLHYILYYMFLWEFIVPWWFARALYNTLTKRAGEWR